MVGYEASIAGGQPGDEVGSWVMLAKATGLLKVPGIINNFYSLKIIFFCFILIFLIYFLSICFPLVHFIGDSINHLALSHFSSFPFLVVASGASATGRQLAAAIGMGACGITMATRFYLFYII